MFSRISQSIQSYFYPQKQIIEEKENWLFCTDKDSFDSKAEEELDKIEKQLTENYCSLLKEITYYNAHRLTALLKLPEHTNSRLKILSILQKERFNSVVMLCVLKSYADCVISPALVYDAVLFQLKDCKDENAGDLKSYYLNMFKRDM